MDESFKTNADPTLVELFRSEADTHIPVLSQGLLDLEKGQADDNSIAAMMRAAHSIKGAARIVGIQAAVRVAHVMEDSFTAAKTNRSILSSDAVDVLLQGVDALQRICALQPDPELNETWLTTILEQLAAVVTGQAPPRSAAAPQHAEVVPVTATVQPGPEAGIEFPPELDDSTIDSVRDRLNAVFSSGPSRIVLDFARVRHVSALGLSLLASMARDLSRLNPAPTLQVEGMSGPVAALLRVSGLDRTMGNGNSARA